MYLIFGLGIFSLYSLLANNSTEELEKTNLYLQWSIAIIGICFVPIYLLLNSYLITKRQAKENKGIIDQYEITKERIVKSDNSSAKKITLNWVNIAKVSENDKAFYFYTTNDAAFIVVKAGEEAESSLILRNLIIQNLKKTPKGKLPFKITDKKYKQEQKELKKNKNK